MPAPSLAIIGYGAAGRWIHAPLLTTTPGLRFAGVCVRDPERTAQATTDHGCRIWRDYAEVLADPAVDGVVLATPTAAHADQVLAALAAGKHVVVDKPVCLTAADLDRLAAAEAASGRTVAAFHNRRWDGDLLTIRRLLDAGVLGRPRVVEMSWGAYGSPRGWRATRAGGGGRIYDLGTHMLDQLCLLMPAAPVDVHARVHGGGGDEVEVHALITVGFADGATGVVETSYINAIAKPRFRVLGTRACFEKHGLDPQEAALRAGDVDAAREDPANHGWLVGDGMRTRVPTVPGRWRSFYDGIRDHLVAGAPNPVPLASVRPAARIIDAAFASARSGAAVRLADPSR